LIRIESSYGEYCGIHYNHEGNIAEIYAKDGRRISYDYSSQGDLIRVTLPNKAIILYEYDQHHRVVRETKPHGHVLENIYDNVGRVLEQRSPMGPYQEMITTATFRYEEGTTQVIDALGGTTTYKIHDKQIYQIIDPLGHTLSQTWFSDAHSWFDPDTETIITGDAQGAVRSLRSQVDRRGLITRYSYNAMGDLVEVTLEGNDLTGQGDTTFTKTFTYNDRYQVVEERVLDRYTKTTYDKQFPYQPSRIEVYSTEGELLSYTYYSYNIKGELIQEDHCGAITLWSYNSRGLPEKKWQKTGTEDPDVVTSYVYSPQGQCILCTSPEGTERFAYDLMGNRIEWERFSPERELLSALYTGYDLNNAPIWEQFANEAHVIYFDYHASGRIKAKREVLTPGVEVAYTLYTHDAQGNLIEETDPRGYTTYREYDAMGRMVRETKGDLTTSFSYEPGGLIKTITSPCGAVTTYRYTTNGLLHEEIYPDATTRTLSYDVHGRQTTERRSDLTWEITYDDNKHHLIKTCNEVQEIYNLDLRGNTLQYTDPLGNTTTSSYDALNRITRKISPSGLITSWHYQGNRILCTLPSHETSITHRALGQEVRREVFDSAGDCIESFALHIDPYQDKEERLYGEQRTLIQKNALGLPLYTEQGELTAHYIYDTVGNCILSIDGDGRKIRQEFDALGRMIRKILADGSTLFFTYDDDSNLIAYSLPDGSLWKASYDSMHRKLQEEIISSQGNTSLSWCFAYEHGHLTKATDPMGREHDYFYDRYGRLTKEIVPGGKRIYAYDACGHLLMAEQHLDRPSSWLGSWLSPTYQERSRIERSYDTEGHLTQERIYLGDDLLQTSSQEWTPSTRTLHVNDHVRLFSYQNGRLISTSTPKGSLHFTYSPSGNLQRTQGPLHTTTITHTAAGLPKVISCNSHQERLSWTPSGRLSTHKTEQKEEHFAYHDLGYLLSTNTEGPPLLNEYNAMGEVSSQGDKKLSWDPWGRLLSVVDSTSSWEASYDALGRRLQTRYHLSAWQTITTNSFYDPEEEFLEIGVQIDKKTFWKVYGPSTCEAVYDEEGGYIALVYNALGQLIELLSEQGAVSPDITPSLYGSLHTTPPPPHDLMSYAKSLCWHSKAQDPTSFIWIGKRYYDAKHGRFLSTDPIAYPTCLDLYIYAHGDPINYQDLDGRFASVVYQTTKSVLIGTMHTLKFDRIIPALNALPSHFAKRQSTRSLSFHVGSSTLSHGAIGFINGINNSPEESQASATRLSQYGQGVQVHGIYNASNFWGMQPLSLGIDIFECTMGHFGIHTPPVQMLKSQWGQFIATHGPTAKFLQICHSGGADHVRNALLTSPDSVRQSIIVLAIAPSVIIPEDLCYRSNNYISRRDFVTHLDIIGKMRYGNQLQVLEPHPDASFWNHSFLSPTFEETIKKSINIHVKNYGGSE